MKAQVKHFNAELGYYSAITENRNKVVFILVEPATLHLGDILDRDIESSGNRTILNETQNTQLKVNVKELHNLDEPFRGHSN
jgi:hypothetical protein